MEPAPTVREAADPYYWVGGDGRPRAIPNSASGDRLVRPCDPNGQTMGPNGQTMGPNGQTMGPNGQTMGPNGQTMCPKWLHHLPKRAPGRTFWSLGRPKRAHHGTKRSDQVAQMVPPCGEYPRPLPETTTEITSESNIETPESVCVRARAARDRSIHDDAPRGVRPAAEAAATPSAARLRGLDGEGRVGRSGLCPAMVRRAQCGVWHTDQAPPAPASVRGPRDPAGGA